MVPPAGQPVTTTAGLSTRQAARRQRLLDAALELLESRDYERIGVREVADSASVALATLYHYFSSKEHLFGEALVQWASTLSSDVTRRPLRSVTPAARLEEAFLRSVRAFERRPQLAHLIGLFELSDEPFARDVMTRLDAATNEVYRGLLPDMAEEEAARVVRVLDAVLDSGLRAWSSGRSSIGDVRQAVSDAVALLVQVRQPICNGSTR
jgi:TetR/AcrR family transcriptional regulator, cholesterol catabolism regulator